MLSNWLDASSSSNRYQQMYIKGFLDISGGNLILRNNNFHLLKGDASLNGRLLVNGDASFNNRLFVNGDVSLNGNLTIQKDLNLLGRLYANYANNSIPITAIEGGVPGTDGIFYVDISLNQRLLVQKDASLNANLYVKGKTILNGDVSLNGKVFVSGNASFINSNTSGNATVTNLKATNIYENGTLIYTKYAPINAPTFTGTVSGITASMVGLGNVNNTADLDKPISTATQSALNLYAPLASPTLTGIPTAPTASYATNTYQVATTAYVVTQISGYNVTLANKYASVSNPNFIGSATIPTLFVTADASLNNRLYVNNDVSMNSNLRVGKTIYEGGRSLITKYATLASPTFTGIATIPTAIINDSLVTLSDSSLNGRLFIGGDASFNSNVFISKTLIANSDSTFNNRVVIAGDTSLNSNVYIGKDLTVNGNLVVKTYTAQQTVTSVNYQFIVAEDMSLNGRLFTTGDVSLNRSLFIGEDTSMNGNLLVKGNVNILGNLTVNTPSVNDNSPLVATTAYVQNQGYAKLVGSQFTGDVSMNSNLQVMGNLISVTQEAADNSTLVATTAFVHNQINILSSNPTFSGEVTTDSLTVNYDSSLNGNLFIGEQIYEKGNALITKYATLSSPTFTGTVTLPATIINDNLKVNNDASLNGNLYVTKRTILNNDVSMNKNLDLSGSIIAHNNINVYGIINQYTTSLDQGYIVNYSNITASGDLIANGVKLTTNTNGENTFFGMTSGASITSGINNTFIGYGAGSNVTSGSNNINIGNGAQSSSNSISNEITIGNGLNTVLRCNVQTITALSDIRDKTNINKLPIGLDFIGELNPVEFEWNVRDGSKMGGKEFGFIAQELKKSQEDLGIIIPNLIYEENPDKLEASYSTLIPIMVNAIKELKELTAKQQIEIDDLKQKLSA